MRADEPGSQVPPEGLFAVGAILVTVAAFFWMRALQRVADLSRRYS